MMEVPGSLREFMIGIQELPGIARVVAAIDAALFRFDDGLHAITDGT